MDANGDFVVVWQSDQQDGSMLGVFGQRFNAAGGKAGGEFGVNTYTLDKQINPTVAMDAAGDFVVAWSSFGQDGSGYGVYARRYNAAGAPRAARSSSSTRRRSTGRSRPTWAWPPTADSSSRGRARQDNITSTSARWTTGFTPACSTPTD